MSAGLAQRLGAVADELEAGAVAPSPGVLWRAGARRRLRQRLVVGGAAVAAVLLLALTVAPAGALTAVPAGRDSTGVHGYPKRIGHQWWTPALGDRPGPLSGLLQSVQEDSGRTEWLAILPGGGVERVPTTPARNDSYPSLSDDGRVVGYLAKPDGPYVLHDLVSGRMVQFDDVTDSAIIDGPQPSGRWWTNGQTPSWFSPDGSRLALAAGARSEDALGSVLLGLDGSQTPLPGVPSARLAGWRDDHTLIGVTTSAPLKIWTYDVRTLRLTEGAQIVGTYIDPVMASQWTFRWSPTAQRLVYQADEQDGTRLGLINPATGAVEGSESMGGDNAVDSCGPVRTAAGPAANADLKGAAALQVPPIDTGPVLVRTDPVLGARCILWAEDAVSGKPTWGLWGTSGAWWTWWWREGLLALVIASGATLAVRARRAHRASPE